MQTPRDRQQTNASFPDLKDKKKRKHFSFILSSCSINFGHIIIYFILYFQQVPHDVHCNFCYIMYIPMLSLYTMPELSYYQWHYLLIILFIYSLTFLVV